MLPQDGRVGSEDEFAASAENEKVHLDPIPETLKISEHQPAGRS